MFLIGLKAGKFKIKVPAHSVKTLFRCAEGHLLSVSSRSRDRNRLSCVSAYKDTNAVHEGSLLVTSLPPNATPWRIRDQRVDFRGTQTFRT